MAPTALTRFDAGRRSRTVTPALRELLSQVDGERCRFPSCPHTRYLQAHHVRFWRHGGPTDLANDALLCGSTTRWRYSPASTGLGSLTRRVLALSAWQTSMVAA